MGYQIASLWVLLLALSITVAYEVRPGRLRNHGHYVCSTWGNFHYKTFDGDVYQFPGTCTYNLASHCHETYQEFSVHIKRDIQNGHPLINKVIVTIKDIVIQLKNSFVVVNGAIAKTPYYRSGILINMNDAYIKVYTKIGLTLMWNQEDALMVELAPSFNNKTCGLCGDYNGVSIYDEFLSGDILLNPIQFGSLQNIHDPNDQCSDPDDTQTVDNTHCSKYRSVCEEHLGQPSFSDCHSLLNLEFYIQACMLDMCSCGQSQDSFCLCSTISEYSRQCSHAGGQPGTWRTDSFCSKQCPSNMIYQESASPCMSTCSHLEIRSLCEEHYMDGCFCPEGMVLDDYTGKGCVQMNECHCKHRGKLYAPGDRISNDCDECNCISGRWNCTDHACPGVCSLEGGAHFNTFDGKKYTFHGNCYYVLSKGGRNDSHVILGELTPCSSSERETCLKSIVLLTDNKQNVVVFKADGTVLLNELKVTLPHATASFSILQPTDSYIILQTTFGLQMQVQLQPLLQLYITMEKWARRHLQGLCGNFNYKEGDDFETSGGLVEATASAFANTWKAQPSCHDKSEWLEDPCGLSIESKNYADYWCSILEKQESVFAKCHSTIDPAEYAKRCQYDTCNCKDSETCMCAALSSYVRACAAKGVILWGWRKGICDKNIATCPSSQIYLYNLTTCPPTCRSLAEGEKVCTTEFAPVDGCGCTEGEYLNEKAECVPVSKCSCYYRGMYFNPLEVIYKQNERCACHNGKFICTTHTNESTSCHNGKIYLDCNKVGRETSKTPIHRSCKTLSVEYFQTECISGCVCPDGLLDDGAGGCIPEERCPCVHNKEIYPHGTQVKVDCNTCLCQRGQWTCTKAPCYGTCTIYGSGHYITFDNKLYDFEGNCEFVAAQDYCGNHHSKGNFSVITENIPCGTTGVTCSKSIKVFLGSTELKLADKHLEETLGDVGKRVQYMSQVVGLYLVIEASNGIILIWDKKTTIFIKVSPAYKGRVCGLCGNFDDNANNDITTSHMLQVADVLEFGNSWKVNPSCPDVTETIHPCSVAPHRKAWAEKQCGLIKSSVFKICHSKVDPTPFYEACVNDACSCDSGGDCECLCTAVAVYAQECNKAGACVYWRTPDICPIFCDYYNPKDECEWHYHPCGNHIETCRSINNVYTNVTINYLEGCYPTCPADKPIFDESKWLCVTKEQCGCYIGNTHYEVNETIPTDEKCISCVCDHTGDSKCTYNQSACFCMVNGTRYEEGDKITSEENSGVCIDIICKNGTEEVQVTICTTTPVITTTTAVTSTQTVPTTTETTPTTTPVISSTCVHEWICEWTAWFDVSTPEKGPDGGDFETYDEIRKHHTLCDVPDQIQCRAKNAPELSLDKVGQTVHCNVSYGLICRNNEQKQEDSLWPLCFDYEIRVNCCRWDCARSTTIPPSTTTTTTHSTPEKTSTVVTTTPIITSTPELTTTVITTSPTVTPEKTTISTTPETTTTTKSTTSTVITSSGITSSVTTTRTTESPTTTACTTEEPPDTTPTSTPTPCEPTCWWTEWFDVSYPEFGLSLGDFETYDNIRKKGHELCEAPLNISCRAEKFKETPLDQVGQKVSCDVSYGLICNNKDQSPIPVCYNYQISVYCCDELCSTTPSQSTSSTTKTTTSVTTTSATTPVSVTRSTTEITTPIQTTTEITTSSISTKFSSPTASTSTACEPICWWTEWIDVSYPEYDINGGDNETYENIKKEGYELCEKPSNISCRAQRFPNKPLDQLDQVVVCDVSTGLICHNKDQTMTTLPVCYNYEIKVYCCDDTICSTSLPTSTPTSTTQSPTTPVTTSITITPTHSTTIPATSTSPTQRTTTSEPTTTSASIQTSTPTTSTSTACEPICWWTEWIDVSYPDYDINGGDNETYENIKKEGYELCEKPSNISCRAQRFPNKPLDQLDQVVVCDVSTGLICHNKDQTMTTLPVCYNYEIKVYCCDDTICSTSLPTSTPTSTTQSPTTPVTTSITITPTHSTTIPATSTSPTQRTTTSEPTTTSASIQTSTPTTSTSTACEPICWWTEWIDVSYPDYDINGGDNETYENIKKEGYELCEKPSNISCRAQRFPNKPLDQLDQVVVCDVSTGLICHNKDQTMTTLPVCYNYEIKVYCCDDTICSTTLPTSTPTSTTQRTTTPLLETSTATETTITTVTTRTPHSTSITPVHNVTIRTPHPTSITPEHNVFTGSTATSTNATEVTTETSTPILPTSTKGTTITYTPSEVFTTSSPTTSFTTTTIYTPSETPVVLTTTSEATTPTHSTTGTTTPTTFPTTTTIYTPPGTSTSTTGYTPSGSPSVSQTTPEQTTTIMSTTKSTTLPTYSTTPTETTTVYTPSETPVVSSTTPEVTTPTHSTTKATTSTSTTVYTPSGTPSVSQTTPEQTTTILSTTKSTTLPTYSTTPTETTTVYTPSGTPSVSQTTPEQTTTILSTTKSTTLPTYSTTPTETTTVYTPSEPPVVSSTTPEITTSTHSTTEATTSTSTTVYTPSGTPFVSQTTPEQTTTIISTTKSTTLPTYSTTPTETTTVYTPSETPVVSSTTPEVTTPTHSTTKATTTTSTTVYTPSGTPSVSQTTPEQTTTILSTTKSTTLPTYSTTPTETTTVYTPSEPPVVSSTTPEITTSKHSTTKVTTPVTSPTTTTLYTTSKVPVISTSTSQQTTLSKMTSSLTTTKVTPTPYVSPSTTTCTTEEPPETTPVSTGIFTSSVTTTTPPTTTKQTPTPEITSGTSPTVTTTSKVTTVSSVQTTSETTIFSSTICTCLHNGIPYPPGEITSGVVNGTWCYVITCTADCQINSNQWYCGLSTTPGATTSKSPPGSTPTPESTTTSPTPPRSTPTPTHSTTEATTTTSTTPSGTPSVSQTTPEQTTTIISTTKSTTLPTYSTTPTETTTVYTPSETPVVSSTTPEVTTPTHSTTKATTTTSTTPSGTPSVSQTTPEQTTTLTSTTKSTTLPTYSTTPTETTTVYTPSEPPVVSSTTPEITTSTHSTTEATTSMSTTVYTPSGTPSVSQTTPEQTTTITSTTKSTTLPTYSTTPTETTTVYTPSETPVVSSTTPEVTTPTHSTTEASTSTSTTVYTPSGTPSVSQTTPEQTTTLTSTTKSTTLPTYSTTPTETTTVYTPSEPPVVSSTTPEITTSTHSTTEATTSMSTTVYTPSGTPSVSQTTPEQTTTITSTTKSTTLPTYSTTPTETTTVYTPSETPVVSSTTPEVTTPTHSTTEASTSTSTTVYTPSGTPSVSQTTPEQTTTIISTTKSTTLPTYSTTPTETTTVYTPSEMPVVSSTTPEVTTPTHSTTKATTTTGTTVYTPSGTPSVSQTTPEQTTTILSKTKSTTLPTYSTTPTETTTVYTPSETPVVSSTTPEVTTPTHSTTEASTSTSTTVYTPSGTPSVSQTTPEQTTTIISTTKSTTLPTYSTTPTETTTVYTPSEMPVVSSTTPEVTTPTHSTTKATTTTGTTVYTPSGTPSVSQTTPEQTTTILSTTKSTTLPTYSTTPTETTTVYTPSETPVVSSTTPEVTTPTHSTTEATTSASTTVYTPSGTPSVSQTTPEQTTTIISTTKSTTLPTYSTTPTETTTVYTPSETPVVSSTTPEVTTPTHSTTKATTTTGTTVYTPSGTPSVSQTTPEQTTTILSTTKSTTLPTYSTTPTETTTAYTPSETPVVSSTTPEVTTPTHSTTEATTSTSTTVYTPSGTPSVSQTTPEQTTTILSTTKSTTLPTYSTTPTETTTVYTTSKSPVVLSTTPEITTSTHSTTKVAAPITSPSTTTLYTTSKLPVISTSTSQQTISKMTSSLTTTKVTPTPYVSPSTTTCTTEEPPETTPVSTGFFTSSVTTTPPTTTKQTPTPEITSGTSPTVTTTSKVTTVSSVPTTSETTISSSTICTCLHNGMPYPPGEITSGVVNGTWCYVITCTADCQINVNQWYCSSSTTPGATTSKSPPGSTPTPESSTTPPAPPGSTPTPETTTTPTSTPTPESTTTPPTPSPPGGTSTHKSTTSLPTPSSPGSTPTPESTTTPTSIPTPESTTTPPTPSLPGSTPTPESTTTPISTPTSQSTTSPPTPSPPGGSPTPETTTSPPTPSPPGSTPTPETTTSPPTTSPPGSTPTPESTTAPPTPSPPGGSPTPETTTSPPTPSPPGSTPTPETTTSPPTTSPPGSTPTPETTTSPPTTSPPGSTPTPESTTAPPTPSPPGGSPTPETTTSPPTPSPSGSTPTPESTTTPPTPSLPGSTPTPESTTTPPTPPGSTPTPESTTTLTSTPTPESTTAPPTPSPPGGSPTPETTTSPPTPSPSGSTPTPESTTTPPTPSLPGSTPKPESTTSPTSTPTPESTTAPPTPSPPGGSPTPETTTSPPTPSPSGSTPTPESTTTPPTPSLPGSTPTPESTTTSPTPPGSTPTPESTTTPTSTPTPESTTTPPTPSPPGGTSTPETTTSAPTTSPPGSTPTVQLSTTTPSPSPPGSTPTPELTTTPPTPSIPGSTPTLVSTTTLQTTTIPLPSTSTQTPTTPSKSTTTTIKTPTPSKPPTTTKLPGCPFEPHREHNETWMLCNCTMARCLENNTVELIELKCEPPPMITCANGRKPVAVPDDDLCCWHWECDCLCSGWGDPHYKTFDGTYYSYQGNCTYVLVEEIMKTVDNFGVYIDNYDCGAKDRVSCPRNIIVRHETQEIQLVVTNLNTLSLQVLVNGQVVGTPYKRYGVKIYESGINYVVEIPELEANITYNGLDFSVKLPYRRFGNNTQGQCGTCTNNRTDDCRLRNGDIISNCEIMADSWVVPDPRKPQCSATAKTTVSPKTTLPSTPCKPSPLCDLINGPAFQKCHKTLPPKDFYQACVFDSCHVPNSNIECTSLQHYALLCGDQSICVEWRHLAPECKITCPPHMVYQPCGPTKHQTCQTTPEEEKEIRANKRVVEGCFCPQYTTLFSPAMQVCVDTCGCVGLDNIPRKFGESFVFECQDCICREGGSGITCTKHKCMKMAEIQCDLEGFYPVVQTSTTDTCCNETICKCDTSLCPKTSPNCGLGYEIVGSIPDGHCCPVYTCVRKNVCVHGNAEYLPGSSVFSDNCQSCTCPKNASSTTGFQIECTHVPCNVECPQGFTLKQVTGDCCGTCVQTHCVLNQLGTDILMNPQQVIHAQNDNCTLYSCTVIKNQFITSVSQISCPYFNEDECEPGTIQLLPNGCCKICIEKSQSCKLEEFYDFMSHNNCRSVQMIKMSRCEGSCGTISMYSAAARSISHKCTCCQEARTSQKHVLLRCSDGSLVDHQYVDVEECNCINTECGPVKAAEDDVSVRARRALRNKRHLGRH